MAIQNDLYLPHSDIITGLAAVDNVVLQGDPHGPRNVAHGETLDLLLDLDLLVVAALHWTHPWQRHKNRNKWVKLYKCFQSQCHRTSRSVKIPQVSAKGRLLQVVEQPSVNSG